MLMLLQSKPVVSDKSEKFGYVKENSMKAGMEDCADLCGFSQFLEDK